LAINLKKAGRIADNSGKISFHARAGKIKVRGVKGKNKLRPLILAENSNRNWITK